MALPLRWLHPASVLLAILAAGTVVPARSFALTNAEAACRAAIAGSVTRQAASAATTVARCHQRRSSGKRPLVDDCNVVARADDRGRLASRRARIIGDVAAACADAGRILADYPQCPAPASSLDDGGPTTGIDTFAELVDCLLALANWNVGRLAQRAQGEPKQLLLDPLVDCQSALGKGAARILRSTLRERARCQSDADRAGGNGDYVCEDADPRGRLQKAHERFSKKATSECTLPPEVLEQMEACSGETAALVSCAADAADFRASAVARSFYGLAGASTTTTTTLPGATSTTLATADCGDTAPACDGECPSGSTCTETSGSCACVDDGNGPCAPATIHRTIVSKFSTTRDSVTSLNAGWSGLGFDIDVPNGSRSTVDVTCDEHCENCGTSLRAVENDPTSNCRCTSDPSVSCTVVNGSDPAHCGSVDPTCRCFYSAPLQITAGGNPACVAVRIRNDFGGTTNLRTGEWNETVNLAAIVYLGLDIDHPCPTCEGDPVVNDGIRGGTCNGGVGSNACDVHGIHPVYGPASNDCLPAAAANISGTGLLIDMNLTTGSVSLPAALPCDTPSGGLCHCRTCTGNSLKSCSSDAECAAIHAGTCTAAGGAGVRLNQCDDFECGADFRCTTGPVDLFCDGKVYPDGSGYVPCQSDGDCSSSGAGTCTLQSLRPCFPDPIVFEGIADRYAPTRVSAFCVAPTSNPAINIATGLPGPGALLLTLDHDVRCQGDPDLEYEFPSGANCPGGPGVTTTTLLPLPLCADADAPACGGLCPNGQVCTDGDGTCSCTGIPLPSCDDAGAPQCGGICPGTGQLCTAVGDGCRCMVVTLPQCLDSAAPVCGGLCPTGELCQSVGDSCECGAPGVPSCGGAVSPTCAGVCDVGEACVDQGGACSCLALPLPVCSGSPSPSCLGTCSLGSRCGDVGGACQCTTLPIP